MGRFTAVHEKWLEEHLSSRDGEKARRLKEGHGHAEALFVKQVWWPAFGNLQYLHPEFEVSDFRDGYRYLDFAYLRKGMQLAIEIDGYGPHLRNASRIQFSDHCRRQNDLITDGWKILRFSYDDVKDSPRYCQQTIQQFLGRWLGEETQTIDADWREKELLRICLKANRPVTPQHISHHLGITPKTARQWLKHLTAKQWLEPAGGSTRIRAYRLLLDRDQINL